MKNQQWQLGPETLIVSRNKKEGNRGGEEEEKRLQGSSTLVIKQLVNLQVKEIRKTNLGWRQAKMAVSLYSHGEAITNHPPLYEWTGRGRGGKKDV